MPNSNLTKMLDTAPDADRTPIKVPLRDQAVAPENLRYGEAPDDGIPELAETIAAAGLMLPLTVRPPRRKSDIVMVLDGRRRLLALQSLRAAGRLPDDATVDCFVETDPARQAAAIVLTNTAVPVHVADIVAAIGKMLKAKLTVASIASALGYGELEVRRLAALSALHPKALEALKAGRCTLRQARLLARLPDQETQAQIAEAALSGVGFQEWRITERLDASQVTIHDRRFAFVGRARYLAAGGRIETDLFGERADVILDPDRLQAAWTARAEALAAAVAGENPWQVVLAVAEPDIGSDDLDPFGSRYGDGADLDATETAIFAAATDAAEAAQAALIGQDLSEDQRDGAIIAYLAARVAQDAAADPTRDVGAIAVFAHARTGLEVQVWGPPAPISDPAASSAEANASESVSADAPAAVSPSQPHPTPVAMPPPADVTGIGHAVHALRTDVATRALVRALADDPATALVAVVARLFSVMVLHQGGGCGGALTLNAEAYSQPRTPPIATLDGEVRRRLGDRKAAWSASGQSPIAWVAGLSDEARLGLLAELAGLSLDLREERTTSQRSGARAEAVEIAALCGADVSRHWLPDAAFLGAHAKAKLLEMLDEMGATDARAAACRKDELVALVAERAAERRWAPGFLNWPAAPLVTVDDDDDPSPQSPAGGTPAAANDTAQADPDASAAETPLAAA